MFDYYQGVIDDLDAVLGCNGGAVLVTVLHFRFSDGPPPTVTMTGLELRDARAASVADGVDFVDGGRLVWHDPRGLDVSLEELAAASVEQRVARLRAATAGRIAELWPESGPE